MTQRFNASLRLFRKPGRLVASAIIGVVALGALTTGTPASAMIVGVAGSQASSVIGHAGTDLTLSSAPTKFVGFDAYGLGTDWGHNHGCGGMFTDAALASLFGALPTHTLVRFDAFEGGLVVNPTTHQLDFAGLDRVFAAATHAGIFLIPVLANEWGACDDGRYKDVSWFTSGYNAPPSAALAAGAGLPLGPLSYRDYVTAVVARYASSPALGMWEPIGEPEATTCASLVPNGCASPPTCSDPASAAALSSFFTDIGGLIHRLDPAHLVEAGFLGGGQCGTGGALYATVGASTGIDVLSFHDYYGPGAVNGDAWNGIAVRIAQARTLNKPLIDGEAGIPASAAGSGCVTTSTRAAQLGAKASGQLTDGVAGFLAWNLEPTPIAGCTLGILASDPAVGSIELAGASAASGG